MSDDRDTTEAETAEAEPAEAAQERRLKRIYTATGASALLIFSAFHPVDLGWLAWFALVPWLVIAATETRFVAVTVSYSVTFLYHLVGLAWIANTTWQGWLLTTFLEGFYGIALGCGSLWLRARARLPLWITLPTLGAALECLRGNTPFIHFPWLFFGNTQHAWDTLIQLADLTSVYGISFLVLMVNGALVELSLLALRGGLDRRAAHHVAVPAAVLLAALGYGAVRRAAVDDATREGPQLLVVQIDVPQNLKDSADPREMVRLNVDATHRILHRLHDSGTLADLDAVVWSETMWPLPILDRRTPERADTYRTWLDALEAEHPNARSLILTFNDELFEIVRRYRVPLLVGAMDSFPWTERTTFDTPLHNSYYAIAPDDAVPEGAAVTARYDKVYLVPASEGIPFQGTWFYDVIKSFVPAGFKTFEPGAGSVVMELEDGHTAAANICFEISFPELLRQHTRAGADIHVCPANDAWFMRGTRLGDVQASAEIPLALAHARLRAIETRRGVVRCVNRGISCVIGPNGDVLERVEGTVDGQRRDVGVEGHLLTTVPTTDLTTLYVSWGNWFPTLCGLIVLLLPFRPQPPNHSPPPSSTPPLSPDTLQG